MNFTAFLAMLARDAHVARRNFVQLAFQILLQPMMFVFVFGRIMTASGLISAQYRSLLLPGIIALSMIMCGTWAVAMPLISEFQFTKEIEDRLLAPMDMEWLAIEKVVSGMIQTLVAGLLVIPMAWLVMGGVSLSGAHVGLFLIIAVLVAALSSTLGLVLGCSVGPQQVGLMFSLVMAPMIFFGCTYYPWSALAKFRILKWVVLVNPLVYASEGFRSSLVPDSPHLPILAVLGALLAFNALLLLLGLRLFKRRAIT
jgi:ABC-2 type transport system permease protein